MIVFVILGQVPLVLAVAQVAMVYLAWVELRKEPGLTFEAKLRWCLLVASSRSAWVVLSMPSGCSAHAPGESSR